MTSKEQGWEERLSEYTDEKNMEHFADCASYGEGQECCLNKLWLKSFIQQEIDRAKEEGYIVRGVVEGKIKDTMIKEHKEAIEKAREEVYEMYYKKDQDEIIRQEARTH